MIENAGIAKLWQGFHHLSENDKDLVLTLAEAVQEQSGGLRCGATDSKEDNPPSEGNYRS